MAVTRVKICCIQSHAEAALAVQYGASAVGLLPMMPGVPEGLSEERIAAIAARLPPGVASFVLTTHQDVASIIALQQRCRAHVVQICDRLTQGTYQELRAALPGVHLVQVVHVTGEDALREAQIVAPHVDGIVLDSGSREGPDKALGGTGRTHDWRISHRVCDMVQVPVFLAGGLRPENVAEAIRQVRPYGVDLCSGVRTNDRLDEGKVRDFFAAINVAST